MAGEWRPSGEVEPRLNPVFPVVGQVKAALEEILERVTDEFNIPELMAKAEERTPYVVVALQECKRMNVLTREIQRSLRELDLGLKVGEAGDGEGGHCPQEPLVGGAPGELESSGHSSLTA